MGVGTRKRYNVAIDGKGFMLKGSPQNPAYIKREASLDLSSLSPDDPAYNPLNGGDWHYWAQTDWSNGFQKLNWEDNATYKDGIRVDTYSRFGEVRLQESARSGVTVLYGGVSAYGAHVVRGDQLINSLIHTGGVSGKVFKAIKLNNALYVAAGYGLSSYLGIKAFNSMSLFGGDALIGMTRTSGTLKTLAKYNGSVVSAFRNANPEVNSVKGIGVRAYTGEYVASLSGSCLYHTTDLSTFTSAFQGGKGTRIKAIEDLNGTPYLFVEDGEDVTMHRFDEYLDKAFPAYIFHSLTDWGVTKYNNKIIVSGTESDNKRAVYEFDGVTVKQIFDDQLQDSSYDFSKPFVYHNRLQVQGAQYDGTAWHPGYYAHRKTIYENTQLLPFATFKGMMIFRGVRISGSAGDMEYQYINEGAANRLYPASGHVIGSDFGHDMAGVDKLVNSVTVNCEALSANETIEMYRSTDSGTTYTSLGKLRSADDGAISSKTLSFPSGFVTKKWLYKAVLCSPPSRNTTPKITDISFQYRPIPDSKAKWRMNLQADNGVQLLNGQKEQRSGHELVSELWVAKQKKTPVIFEDVHAISAKITATLTKTATSAKVENTDGWPRKGRIRVVSGGVAEEMTYTSADGNKVMGISRGQKGTKARQYSTSYSMDNSHTVLITDLEERLVDTDDQKQESVVSISLLEI